MVVNLVKSFTLYSTSNHVMIKREKRILNFFHRLHLLLRKGLCKVNLNSKKLLRKKQERERMSEKRKAAMAKDE